MKRKNKKYKICDYNHRPNECSYVNIDSVSPEDGWVTTVPIGKKELSELQEKPTPIKYFSSKSEAQEYLDVIRNHRNSDWERNRYIYMINGYKKPMWKIYHEN
jgi:hypothetical protein